MWQAVDISTDDPDWDAFAEHDAWTTRLASDLTDVHAAPTRLLANVRELSGRRRAALFAVAGVGWYSFTDPDDISPQHYETLMSCFAAYCPAIRDACFDGAQEPVLDWESGFAGTFCADSRA